jgi:hypothetical protein
MSRFSLYSGSNVRCAFRNFGTAIDSLLLENNFLEGKMKKAIYVLLAALTIIGMVSCGGGGGGEGSTTVTINFDLNMPDTYDGPDISTFPSVTFVKGGQIGNDLPAGPTQVQVGSEDQDLAEFGIMFKGWYTLAEGGTKVTSDSLFSADATLFAQWVSWDVESEVAVIFDPNYPGADVIVKIIDADATIPEDQWPVVTRGGTYTNGDPWVFNGWTQYDFGAGDQYGVESGEGGKIGSGGVTGFSSSVTIYAQWKPQNGWPVENPPAGTDLAGAEKVILKNGNMAMYYFVLPDGRTWSDYAKITAQIMVGPGDLDTTNSVRNFRLLGNYLAGDFTIVSIDATANPAHEKVAVTPHNTSGDKTTNKLAPYILHEGPSWTTIRSAIKTVTGEDAKPWEWFIADYDITGAKKHSSYDMSNLPDNTDTGPFFFALGMSGAQDSGTTQWIKNITLVGNTGIPSVKATPVYFTVGNDVIPGFSAYPTGDGGNGVKELYRGMADGTNPPTIPLTVPMVTITVNQNYVSAEEPEEFEIAQGTALGSSLATPTQTGFGFVEWNTAADGSGTTVTSSTTFAVDTEIFAIWAAEIIITVNLNYGGLTPTFITIGEGGSLGDQFPANPTREMYLFKGWFNKDGTGDDWGTEVKATTTFSAASVIYARWNVAPTIPSVTNTPTPTRQGNDDGPDGSLTVTGTTVTVDNKKTRTNIGFSYPLVATWDDYTTLKLTFTVVINEGVAKVTAKKGTTFTDLNTPKYIDLEAGENVIEIPVSTLRPMATNDICFQINSWGGEGLDMVMDFTVVCDKIELIP